MNALLLTLTGMLMGIALAGCDGESVRIVLPQEPGPEAIAYYCGMNVSEHAGPKGQVFVTGQETPFWFVSVRDTLAFVKSPEEPKNIAAIFVSDTGKAVNWQRPKPGAWVEVHDAIFVTGSDARGGMGVAEVVPFSDEAAAEQFRAEHGGEIHMFDEVPEQYIFGVGDPQMSSASDADVNSDHAGH